MAFLSPCLACSFSVCAYIPFEARFGSESGVESCGSVEREEAVVDSK